MRGSSRPTSVKHPGHPPSSGQTQAANSAQIYTSQRPSTYFDGSYANQSQQQFGINLAGIPVQGANTSSQFVQQVIYNQGSVVINNAGSGPSVSIPAGGYTNNYPANTSNSRSQTAVNSAVQNSVVSGHQKTKSASAATNQQNPLLGNNGAPAQSSHHRYPTNGGLIQEVTRKIQVKPQQHNVQIQSTVTQANSSTLQVGAQNVQTAQTNHKKTQSLAQNKLTQLLIKSQKKGQQPATKNQDQSDSQQQSIDLILQQHQVQQRKKQHNTALEKENELLRILREQRNVQDLSYQNQTSSGSRESTFTQSFGKHTRAATQGASQFISSYEKALGNEVIAVQQPHPTQKSVRPSSSSKPINIEQQAKQQKHSSFVGTTDKIASSGKVIASGSMIKKTSVNKATSSNQNNVQIQSQHHRIKSDQHYSLKSKELFAGGVIPSNLVLNQKGKVGKILKNNYVESAVDQQQNLVMNLQGVAPAEKSLNSSIGGHSSFNVGQAANSKGVNRTFQHPSGSSQIQALTGSQIGKVVASQNHQKKISVTMNAGVVQNQSQLQAQSHRKKVAKDNKNRQSTKEKYVELQGLYNKLLERHVSLLHTNKPALNQLQASASGNSNISLNQLVNNAAYSQSLNARMAKFMGAAQSQNGQNYLYTLGAQDEAINQNQKVVVAQAEARGQSWDGKLNYQKAEALSDTKEQEMRVPPQSSTSSARNLIPNILGHQQQAAEKLKTQIQFSASGLSSNLISLTSEVKLQDQLRLSQIESLQKVTPLSSGRSSSQFLKQLNQLQSNGLQESFKLNAKQKGQVAKQNETKPSKRTVDAVRHRRSLSNGTNEQTNLKFQHTVKGQIQQTQAQTTQPTIVQPDVQRQSKNNKMKSPLKHQDRHSSDRVTQMSQVLQNNLKTTENGQISELQTQKLNTGRRPKSNQIPAEVRHSKNSDHSFLFQGNKFAQTNNKFKLSTSTHESPVVEKKEVKVPQAAFHHPQMSLQIPQAVVRKTQAMVIQENTPPQSPQVQEEVIQLSEWDKMIQAQNVRPLQAPLLNNLMQDLPAQVFQPTRKGHHIKNKHSVHSDASVTHHVRQQNLSQYADNLALVQQQNQHFQIQERPNHKRVKSDVVEHHERKLISIADFVQNQGKIAGQSNQEKGQPHSSGAQSIHSMNNSKKDAITHQIENAFQRGGKNLKQSKVVNISIQQIELAEEETETAAPKPLKVQAKDKSERGHQSQHSNELIKNDKYKHILRRAKVTYNNGQKTTEQSSQPTQSVNQDQPGRKVPLQVVQAREISNVPLNSANPSVKNTPKYDRIETQESIESNIPPKEKLIKKLTHHIKESFKRSGECPSTTVEFYRVGKILGKGAFGKVNLAQQQLTQLLVAIKSINKTHFSEESQSKKVMQEVMILKQTRHRNIIRLFEYFETQKHILFVIELSSGGDLLSYVRKRRQLKEEVAKSVFKQIIEGIKYCHSKKILHRDIKLDNILLTVEGVVKICDFGVSKVVKPGEKMSEQCGTPAYIAPEILLDKGYEGFAVDIWSAGVVLYAMLYGTVPFKANNMSELQKMIIKAKFTLQEGISKEAKDLLRLILEKDPSLRITIPNILAHPWMRDAKDSVELFTNAEKNYMKYEFSCQEQGGLPELDPKNGDPFMDQMLDTLQNSELKNAETKSIILAPFNSTKSNLEEVERNFSLSSEIKDMIQSKSCLKFAPKVREIDKQYEVNNNAELDNGVYHDFNKDEKPVEKEDSLQSDFRESMNSQNKKPQTELQKLEKMIMKQEAVRDYAQTKNPQEQNLRFSTEDVVATSEPIPEIDDEILQQVVQFGYPARETRKYLHKCELNSATTTYYLLEIQKQSSLADTTQNVK